MKASIIIASKGRPGRASRSRVDVGECARQVVAHERHRGARDDQHADVPQLLAGQNHAFGGR